MSQTTMSNSDSGPSSESRPFLSRHNVGSDIELGQFEASRDQQVTDARERFSLDEDQDDNYHDDDEYQHVEDSNVRANSSRISKPSFLSIFRCGQRQRGSQDIQSSLSGKSLAPRKRLVKKLLRLLALLLMFFGVIQIFSLALSIAQAFFPDIFSYTADNWQDTEDSNDLHHWPTDSTRDIVPVACHSHNDYWRRVPLFSALKAGCTGVEADVWLFHDDDNLNNSELYVGHSRSSLTTMRTLNSLYITPLLDLLEKQNPTSQFQPILNDPRNGVFDTNPEQTLVLLIDFKTDGEDLWPVVSNHLSPLRENNYLTHFNGSHIIQGPITVVATGNAQFHNVIANTTYRDIFFDAPLQDLVVDNDNHIDDDDDNTSKSETNNDKTTPPIPIESFTYNPNLETAYLTSLQSTNSTTNTNIHKPTNPKIYTPFNSHYASTSLQSTLFPSSSSTSSILTSLFQQYKYTHLTRPQTRLLRAQISAAHTAGLRARYWETPAWPVGLRNYVWEGLMGLGVDVLNVDDLEGAVRRGWGWRGKGGRGGGSWWWWWRGGIWG